MFFGLQIVTFTGRLQVAFDLVYGMGIGCSCDQSRGSIFCTFPRPWLRIWVEATVKISGLAARGVVYVVRPAGWESSIPKLSPSDGNAVATIGLRRGRSVDTSKRETPLGPPSYPITTSIIKRGENLIFARKDANMEPSADRIAKSLKFKLHIIMMLTFLMTARAVTDQIGTNPSFSSFKTIF